MTPRTRRRVVAVGLVAAACGYLQLATFVEQRAISAQEPALTSPSAAARYVERGRVMRDVASLSAPGLAGRRTGTDGARKAREWLVEQFKASPLTPAGSDGYLQPFRTVSRDAANVIGSIAGRRSDALPLVVSAHYDHLGIQDGVLYPGADDNASGVAVLLAAARYFVANPPERPFVFAAFDAEELGLHGARAYVASRPTGQVAALNVNLDMVSRSDRNEIFAVGTYHYPHLKPLLEEVQTRASVKILFGHDRPIRSAGRAEDWTRLSDHAAFHDAGVPFVYFGVDYHPDYHRPTDTLDKIEPQFVGDVADMVVEALRTFDRELP